MKEIGGYFGLEELSGTEYYADLIPLNSGRNALLYICLAKNIRKLYLPYFLCSCISDMCREHGIEVSFYHINEQLMPLLEAKPHDGQAVYVVNYYGRLDCGAVERLQDRYNGRLIVDNTHAFFQAPVSGVDTLYTCRKFFGVPDGAYLATDKKLVQPLAREEVRENMGHILGRYEKCASGFYSEYQKNDDRFYYAPLKRMSKISSNILRGLNYEMISEKRTKNYCWLRQKLDTSNLLETELHAGPFCYPLFCKNGIQVRQYLIQHGVYIPTLWPNVLQLENCPLEKNFAKNILPIPCDQRYNLADMKIITELLWQTGVIQP